MDEFALIRRYFADWSSAPSDVVLGIGDDAALLSVPGGHELVVTTDTLVAGRHFPLTTAPQDIGWKALAVNLSDLAAMGAQPRWFTLALTLPEPDESWLVAFASGLRALADQHAVVLVGGDTTRGPLSITITAMGVVPAGQAIRRSGAQVGDLICVTGTLGDAALALHQLDRSMASEADRFLRAGMDRPTARIEAGLGLRGLASAALDLSDGLAGDLRHLCTASGVGAEIDPQALPPSTAFQQATASMSDAERFALQAQGGDDYELCFCLPAEKLGEAQQRLSTLNLPLTVIGCITAEPGLRLRYADGHITPLTTTGYSHF